MTVWKLEPHAHPDDPRWQDRAIYEEVIVRAESAAAARALATQLDADPAESGSTSDAIAARSGFLDEKLYHAVQLSQEDAAELPACPDHSPILRARRLDPKDQVDLARPPKTD